MTRQEVDIAIDWAAAEGWNPGLDDADCFYATDPNDFPVGLLGDDPIATISVVKYGESFGFLGFYIVKPEYRGKGYGIQICNAGLAYRRVILQKLIWIDSSTPPGRWAVAGGGTFGDLVVVGSGLEAGGTKGKNTP